MSELGKAYVQIVPSAKGIKGKITEMMDGESSDAGKTGGESFAASFIATAKKALVAIGIGKIIGDALNQGGQLQQTLGGIETLFGDSADKMKEYATHAFETTGLSSNEYMQNVTGFSASLLQSLGGDTEKAADIADMAMRDMSDNANKMGTSMDAITTAYQGFAKQNYTMLDNLKLGYGGTKTEMERLLKDAQKISGVKYNIDNLNDVYEAIHVIQTEMNISGYSVDELNHKLSDMTLTSDELQRVADDLGITYEEAAERMKNGTLTAKDAQVLLGTTAKEASSTLEGSFNSMKAAWTDLLGQIALGGDIQTALANLTATVSTYLFGNLIPMFTEIVSQIPTVIAGLVQGFTDNIDLIIQAGIDLVSGIITGVMTALPLLGEAFTNLYLKVVEVMTTTDWASIGSDILTAINTGLTSTIPNILESIAGMITGMDGALQDSMPAFLEEGFNFIMQMITGIMDGLPSIIESLGSVVFSLINLLINNLPKFLEEGGKFIANMITGISGKLPTILSTMGSLVGKLLAKLVEALPDFLAKGVDFVLQIIAGLINSIPDLLSAAGELVTSAMDAMTNVDWASVGSSIIDGIVAGLKAFGGAIANTLTSLASSAWNGICSFLGIKSPSRLMRDTVGRYIAEGIAVGIEESAYKVDDAMEQIATDVSTFPIEPDLNVNGSISAVQPASTGNQYGNVNIEIKASDYNNAKEIAQAVKEIIINDFNRDEVVFA